MLKIYLAGPTVFYEDAIRRGEDLKKVCTDYGFKGLFPMDNTVQPGTKKDMATAIYQGNIALIKEADIVIADINPFRGHEPDSGTCFEIGYADALNKPVYAYISNDSELIERITTSKKDGVCFDSDGMIVEDFGLSANIMIGIAATVVIGTFHDCIEVIRANHII